MSDNKIETIKLKIMNQVLEADSVYADLMIKFSGNRASPLGYGWFSMKDLGLYYGVFRNVDDEKQFSVTFYEESEINEMGIDDIIDIELRSNFLIKRMYESIFFSPNDIILSGEVSALERKEDGRLYWFKSDSDSYKISLSHYIDDENEESVNYVTRRNLYGNVVYGASCKITDEIIQRVEAIKPENEILMSFKPTLILLLKECQKVEGYMTNIIILQKLQQFIELEKYRIN